MMLLVLMGLLLQVSGVQLINYDTNMANWTIVNDEQVQQHTVLLLRLVFDQPIFMTQSNAPYRSLSRIIHLNHILRLKCPHSYEMIGLEQHNSHQFSQQTLYKIHSSLQAFHPISRSSNIISFMILRPNIHEIPQGECTVVFSKELVSFDGYGLDDCMLTLQPDHANRTVVWFNISTEDTTEMDGDSEFSQELCRQSKRKEQTIFIEEAAELTMGPLLQPMMSVGLDPMSSAVTDGGLSDSQADVTGNLQHSTDAGAEKIIKWVSEAVSRNVSNLLPDSVTYHLSERLSKSLTNALAPDLTNTIVDFCEEPIFESLHESLKRTLPEKLERDIPLELERSLVLSVFLKLSKSATHGIVPALALGLSHTAGQGIACKKCVEMNLECWKCQYSLDRLRYFNYEFTYYCDYYGNYYSNYYLYALQNLDSVEYKPDE